MEYKARKTPSPNGTAGRTTVYDRFRGVDFSTDPYLVDRGRSPYAVNLVSDKGGQPEKRLGWRALYTIEQPVNALAFGYIGQSLVLLAHGGTKLYRLSEGTATLLREGLQSAKSNIFFAARGEGTAAYIMTGAQYLIYDGESVGDVTEVATIPRVLIGGKPTGGGTVLYPVNLLQKKRTEERQGDATTKLYQLSANQLDADAVEVKLKNADGSFSPLAEGTGFSVDRATGILTFVAAPPKPAVTGEDNVFITYAKTVEGYAERITKSAITAGYSVGNATFIFAAKNPDYRARDFWSYANDPTYFPDTNYSVVGNANNRIMNYAKLGQYLMVIKEDNQQDTSIFIREPYESKNALSGVLETAFSLKPGVTGTGALSSHSFANLIDEPLFLSRTGVHAITSNVITAERTLQNRSYYVNARLLREPGLDRAVATEWNGYYLLAVNGHVYLLDSRQRSEGKNPSNYYYEAYYWENVPATCFMVMDGELYFGTGDGRVCKFNSDIDTMARFNDDGQPIVAVWSTKMDDDGLPSMRKTMQKRGCMVTLKPLTRSGVKISVKTEKDTSARQIHEASAGILDWGEIAFEEFTFVSNDNARPIVFKKKEKKYWAMQLIVMNDKQSQGFGVFNIVKRWLPNSELKR